MKTPQHHIQADQTHSAAPSTSQPRQVRQAFPAATAVADSPRMTAQRQAIRAAFGAHAASAQLQVDAEPQLVGGSKRQDFTNPAAPNLARMAVQRQAFRAASGPATEAWHMVPPQAVAQQLRKGRPPAGLQPSALVQRRGFTDQELKEFFPADAKVDAKDAKAPAPPLDAITQDPLAKDADFVKLGAAYYTVQSLLQIAAQGNMRMADGLLLSAHAVAIQPQVTDPQWADIKAGMEKAWHAPDNLGIGDHGGNDDAGDNGNGQAAGAAAAAAAQPIAGAADDMDDFFGDNFMAQVADFKAGNQLAFHRPAPDQDHD